nr:hypothetical protein GGHGEOLK_00007 [White spot syndrome virus]
MSKIFSPPLSFHSLNIFSTDAEKDSIEGGLAIDKLFDFFKMGNWFPNTASSLEKFPC